MRYTLFVVVVGLSLIACSGELPVVGGRLVDASNDLGPVDVPLNGPADVMPDASPDVALDTAMDVASDVVPDIAMDVAPEPPFRCMSNADCTAMAATPVCDVASGRCVRCTVTDDRCPADQHCNPMTLSCVAGCRADEGCPMGRRCDTTARACVECITDAHCPAGRVCSSNACVPGCNATQPCAAGSTCCASTCVDTQTSVAHCGSCGARCELANGTARCAAGRCAVDACTAPFADCDMNASNGCEVDTRTTLAHCGACRMACAVANGTPACRAGRCEVASCTAGFADCDMNASNGCEVDTRTTVTHCGMCGRSCVAGPNQGASCTAGTCSFTCNAGFADCDGNTANGCEVDTRTTVTHCGMCGRSCVAGPNQGASCTAGTCSFTCNAGFADCDGNTANGCEVDTRTTVTHCGACRMACAVANGTPACRAGRCEVASCTAGFADCDMNASNGCEVDTRTNTAHCGMCRRACGVGETCVAGACTIPLEVTGCTRGGGGTAAGANVFRQFCSVRGRIGVISGAIATATSTTLTVPFAELPVGARVVRAFLYRQTYDRTATYLTAWTLLGSNLIPTTDFIGTSTSNPLQVARVEITDLLRAVPTAADGSRSLPLTQAPNTSSGGFAWWMIYEAPSLPERTVVVFDGMHTDRMAGNGAFTFTGFNASTTPPSATLHIFGGGDDPDDAPSVARVNPGTELIVNDVTHPGAGDYAGVVVEALDDRMSPGATTTTVEFTLRNYSAVSFALLEVATGNPSTPCSPACPTGQTCESGRCFPSEGCRVSLRRGFTDVTRFPNIAACGARATFDAATALSANVCAVGWRPCTPEDVSRERGDAPDFVTPGSFGWVLWVDGATDRYGNFTTSRCGGVATAVANLRGTSGCTPSGVFPEGWRLAIDANTWTWSHARTGPCVEHATHRCAFAGGSVSQERGHTLCCRNL